MSRITPPIGYTTWNAYIDTQVIGITDIYARRLIKRNIKLSQIAQVERQAGGDQTNNSFRQYNTYVSPGTVSPVVAHPWSLDALITSTEVTTENNSVLMTENNLILLV